MFSVWSSIRLTGAQSTREPSSLESFEGQSARKQEIERESVSKIQEVKSIEGNRHKELVNNREKERGGKFRGRLDRRDEELEEVCGGNGRCEPEDESDSRRSCGGGGAQFKQHEQRGRFGQLQPQLNTSSSSQCEQVAA